MSENSVVGVERIRQRLEALPGVRDVDLSGFPGRIEVRCDLAATRELTAEAVRRLVQRETSARPVVDVTLVGGPPQAEGRARFKSLSVQGREGISTVRVVLDWQKKSYEGEATAETSPAGDLRASATAAARAVEGVSEGAVTFTLVGIKEMHVFDHDLVAVLLHCPELPDRRLLGTSLIAGDRNRSAALAVLNATNRAIGNFTAADDG